MPPLRKHRGKAAKRPNASRRSGTAFTKAVTTGPGRVVEHIQLRTSLHEPKTLGTIVSTDLEFSQTSFPYLARYSQVKINRVGIAVLPRSYMEFVALGVTWSKIDTRLELIGMPDCEHIWSYTGGPTIRWYKPDEGVFRTWQDLPSSATVIKSGLHLTYTGTNDLNPAGDGILAGVWYDVTLRGANSGPAPQSLFELEEQVRQLRLAQADTDFVHVNCEP